MNAKYIQKWEDKINEVRKSLIKEDFNSYDDKMLELNNLYEQYKKDILLTYECTNFGMAKYIFENNLKDLFLTKKNAVKEYINTVKNDKNLTVQSHLFEALSNYNGIGDSIKFTNDVFDLALSNIDKKTLKESNQKIFNIIKKYDIKPNDFISHDKLSFFEQCDYILKNEKKIYNINEIQSVMSLISEHVRDNSKKHLNESNFNLNKSIAEFENKISSKFCQKVITSFPETEKGKKNVLYIVNYCAGLFNSNFQHIFCHLLCIEMYLSEITAFLLLFFRKCCIM
jgi:hypothetical protein